MKVENGTPVIFLCCEKVLPKPKLKSIYHETFYSNFNF